MLRSKKPIVSLLGLLIISAWALVGALDLDVTDGGETVESLDPRNEAIASLEITSSQDIDGIEAGSTPSLICRLSEPGTIFWIAKGKNLTTIRESEFRGRLDIKQASRNDSGDYTCMASTNSGESLDKTIRIRVIEPGRITPEKNVRVKLSGVAKLSCNIYGFPLSNFTWLKGNDTENGEHLEYPTTVNKINDTHVIMTLNFKSVAKRDNGTYICKAHDYNGAISAYRHLFVMDVPQISIDFVKAVGARSIFVNWTVNDGNEKIKNYIVQHMKNGTESWQYYVEQIGTGNSSYVIKGLEPRTAYKIKLSASNSLGSSHPIISPDYVTTLEKDPIFVPKGYVSGANDISITLRWNPPPPDLQEHVHYYNLVAIHGDQKRETMFPAQPDTSYSFVDLEPAKEYKFKIAACSEYTKLCGNWSSEINGTTMDGMSSAPRNLSVVCRYDNISRTSFVSVTWSPPERPNGQILHYNLRLSGLSVYKNDMGRSEMEQWGPKNWNAAGARTSSTFDAPPNTNYSVGIYALTRTRVAGTEAVANCSMPPTVPDRESLNMRSWHKIENQGRQLLKLYLPRISERNGKICCYRIFLVKMEQHKTLADLPLPEEIGVYSYQYVHSRPEGGAYVAESFDSDRLAQEVFLGDGESYNASDACNKCIGLKPRPPPPLLNVVPEPPPQIIFNASSGDGVFTTNPTSPTETTSGIVASPTAGGGGVTTAVPPASTTTFAASSTAAAAAAFTGTLAPTVARANETENATRRKRENTSASKMILVDRASELLPYPPQDGFLDENSNYSGFIEVIVYGSGDQLLPAYSSYFNPLYGGIDPKNISAQEVTTLRLILQVSLALILIIICLLFVLCALHKYTKRVQQRGEEIITLRNSFRHLCRSLRGRHQLVAASPPDMPPVVKGELLQAYLERHRDSDYGFQHEFELLPDKFTDRTTRASEARENLYKNRYPDIKCYDQTRVRLAQMDGIAGSDYINANFVLGYKERKKFICAQGPMENTVCDYWRMIWEQHLELVLMLTNLEEYSKTKCAKYWPDKGETKNFGDISVEHTRDRAYSDYVIRELKMTRTGERDPRTIVQYHFLVWKDFMAPEHPHAILRFIKRVNEAYSLEKGPILVHCSAGVGRTGTLVALDSLLQQLADECQVSIFNTVCDLRHQRNFLVQSLKQYIFIYRALMEMAQYGDTEIQASQLKATVDKLRQRDNGKEKNRMEEEYDKISSVLEDRKSFSVGSGEENRTKNRCELVIPYDRNRVILTPMPGKEHSTYINASFIEGYDNSESFVITQDPIETTIADFWRMISEQCISTIVMLSDLNEGPRKCPRYWPDDEAVYDHIRVRYIQSESCPYFTRRELSVTNTKTNETVVVTQYQYHGWPTVEGEVPEVTRGVIELVDQMIANAGESSGPLVVHCSSGSDRSSMFVALSILVQQLRTEKRVDIFTTTKKLRSQRHGMISTFVQYEFLHRAIVNYSDLHKLAEEDSPSS